MKLRERLLPRKRGRPAKQAPISLGDMQKMKDAHEANIQRLITEREPVHWEEVAHKQENELITLRVENDELARICVMRHDTIADLKKIISYLESKLFKNEDSSI